MNEFNIGDKVISNDDCYSGKEVGIIVGIDPEAKAHDGKYLVKFDSINGWEYELFSNDPNYIVEPYEGRAIWLDDLVKVEDECEEICMNEFNIGDKVISNDSHYLSEEVGTIVGIDTRKNASRKYLIKFDSLDISEGWAYGCFRDISLLIIEPYDGYAIWLDDLEKVEDKCEEDMRIKFESVRKQKEEIIKEKSKKVLQLTLEIKEIEHEIEKIKKEWHL